MMSAANAPINLPMDRPTLPDVFGLRTSLPCLTPLYEMCQ